MKKKARVNLTNPKPGDKCVVADFVGTTIYTVASISGDGMNGSAMLNYPREDGTMVSGGMHPLWCCYVPTKAQLDHKQH